MAPSPLPTELISHILELLYDDVRSRDVVDPTKWDKWDGIKVPSVFFPILTVSKTFHALALPILYRHIFLADRFKRSSGFPSQRQLTRSSLRWTRALQVHDQHDEVLTNYHKLFDRCSSLRSLDISCEWSFKASHFPSTLVALKLELTFMFVEHSNLVAISTSLPNLKMLELAIEWTSEMDGYLHRHGSWRAASPLVHWLNEAKETLKTLVLGDLMLNTDFDTVWSGEDVLEGLNGSMTALRYLDITIFDSDTDLISAERFPSLTHLNASVDAASIRSILTTATTLETAGISLDGLDLSDQSIIAVIVEFLTGHSSMRRFELNVDYGEHDVQVNAVPDGWWGRPIVELCDERGILFCCDHRGAFGEDWEAEWAPSNNGAEAEDSQSSIGSSGIEDADDFDAEDEELWAQHWTEEKRVALGIVVPLDGEPVASAQARPLRRSARLQS